MLEMQWPTKKNTKRQIKKIKELVPLLLF